MSLDTMTFVRATFARPSLARPITGQTLPCIPDPRARGRKKYIHFQSLTVARVNVDRARVVVPVFGIIWLDKMQAYSSHPLIVSLKFQLISAIFVKRSYFV